MEDFYLKTLNWIEETVSDKRLINNCYKEFYEDETIMFPPTKGYDPPQWNSIDKFEKPYTAIVENGSIWTNSNKMSFIMTPNNKLLRDVVHFSYWDHFSAKDIPPYLFYDETVAVLVWAGETNYYHWLHDTIARFHLLNLSGIKIDKYVMQKLTLPFQFETLNKLQIPLEKIIQIDGDNFHLKAKQLVVSSIPAYSGGTGRSVKWACNFLRDTLMDVKTDDRNWKTGFERIYISREDVQIRKVINEDNVMRVLSRKGFKKVALSSLSVKEQIEIFSSAKIVIAPYGASLTNIIFCQPGTKIIQLYLKPPFEELYKDKDYMKEFFRIGFYMDLDYYFLACVTTSPLHSNLLMNNLVVNIAILSKIIDFLR